MPQDKRKWLPCFVVGLFAMASLLGAASSARAADASPQLLRLEIKTDTQPVTPSGWEGWATYDILELRVEPTWSDGQKDLDCSRAGTTPRWKTDYGWFEPPKDGPRVLWRAKIKPGWSCPTVVGDDVYLCWTEFWKPTLNLLDMVQPVLSRGRLYIRTPEELICYHVAAE